MPYTRITHIFLETRRTLALAVRGGCAFYVAIYLCIIFFCNPTWAYAVYTVKDTYGPELAFVHVNKEFRGSISQVRKNFPSAREQAQDKYKALVPSVAVRSVPVQAEAGDGGRAARVTEEKKRRAALAKASKSQQHILTLATPSLNILRNTNMDVRETGLSAGSSYVGGSRTVTLMPKYKDFLMYGITNNTIDSNYRSDLSGLSLVANIALDSVMRVGLTLDIGIGHTAFVGDHYNTNNVYDYWGASLYAGYNFHNIGLLFDVGYSSEYSDMEQPQSAAMLKGSVDSDSGNTTFTAGLRTEYRIETDLMTIAPHVGVRYTSTNVDRYGLHSDTENPAAWTIPVGVTLSTDIETVDGWTFVPSVDVGFVGTIGNLDATSSVPNTENFTNFKMQAVDEFAFDGGIGLSLAKENLSFDINYNVQFSPKKTGHLLSGLLRYEF